jgi:hypothetical protein
MTPEGPEPLRVFCSYAREDEEEHLNNLHESLYSLESGGLIEWWHDRAITAGRKYEEDIEEHLRTADVILFLVSREFMASPFINEKEIGRAVERHKGHEARLIPIIVRPALWKRSPLGKLQALPKDGRPITTWPNQDEAWLDVANGIEKAVGEILFERQKQAARELERQQRLEKGYKPGTGGGGSDWGYDPTSSIGGNEF